MIHYKGKELLAFIFALGSVLTISRDASSQQIVPANFQDSLVSTGWNQLEGFEFDATGQMYVWEKDGYVWVVDTNGVKITTPLLDIREEVGGWRDHGLNGFALHPDFRTNGYYYCYYTVDRHHLINFGTGSYNSTWDTYFAATIVRVTRYQANAATNFTTTVPGSRFILIGETKKTGIPLMHETHSGGQLVFGDDGTLLISTGDGASYGTVDTGSIAHSYYAQALADTIIRAKENIGAFRSQMVDCLNGKILRIDPMTGNGIPSNPYYDAGAPRAAKSRVWALGLRNPFRMCLRPGSGNSDASLGDPGTLYIGDVGWTLWEDLSVCDKPDMNFGWPNYEGLEPHPDYNMALTKNTDAPNPLFGVGGCTRQYLYFNELLKQPAKNGVVTFPITSCNGQTGNVPANVPHWVHARPSLDWKHNTVQARTGSWNGNNASQINLGAVGCPVTGPSFAGNASVAGTWYTGSKYPVQYQNTYFHADYGAEWIKNIIFNNLDSPIVASAFGDSLGPVVFVTMNPRDQLIWYVKYPDQIRKIKYALSVNNFPTAVATQNVSYGTSPLSVSFTGSQSSDPENLPLTYLWNFGDGTPTSTLQNPSHVFTAPSGVPTTYTVTLTVKDNVLQSNSTTLKVYVNNTPPQISITSPVNNSFYTMSQNTNMLCTANVTDAEHTPAQLTYAWQTILHHNTHTHPEAIDNNPVTTTIITPEGCNGETFYFEQKLTVTDAAGLASTSSSFIYPACTAPVSAFTANILAVCPGTTINFIDQSSSLPDNYAWTFTGGMPSTSNLKNPSIVYNTPGVYSVSLTVSNIWGGNTLTKTGYITVGSFSATAFPSGTINFCAGSSLTLTANTGAGISYQWYKNGVAQAGATSSSYLIGNAGTYYVVETSSCGIATSNSVVVNQINNPNPVVTYTTPTTFCSPGNILFAANTFAGVTYQWQKNSVDIPGATAQTYLATTNGKYRVKETANGCTKQNSDVQVSTATSVTATIAANGPVTFCTGGSVVLSETNNIPGYSYQWKNNGVNIAGATTSSYTATTAGTYTCTVSASCGSATSNSIVVSTGGIVALVNPNGTVNICNGATVAFSANAGTGYVYQWKKNGANISGATSANYSATTAGSYTVAITSPCGNATSAATTVNITALTANITPTGTTTICNGSAAMFTANTGYNYTYQWYRAGLAIAGASASTHANSTAGNYTVVITQGGVCSATSNIALLAVTNNPNPSVTAGGPTTFCVGQSVTLTANTFTGVTYQWIKGSTNIVGATNQSYTATTAGQYSVKETANGCTKQLGVPIVVTVNCRITGERQEISEIKVKPNPFANELEVYGLPFTAGDRIELVDILGRTALAKTINEPTSNFKLQTLNLPPGIYFMQVATLTEKKTLKVVKQ